MSFGALVVPVLAAFGFADTAASYDILLWLLALVPALLLSYYRGWRGAVVAVVIGMVVLVAIQIALLMSGRELQSWPLLLGVVVADIAIAFGIGTVTELLHRERARAEWLALTDELTGIPNRRYARMFLETELAAAGRGRRVVVVMFDLDDFKAFNDTHGHIKGDDVLRTFAGVLHKTTRRMCLSARYGGEEFITILSSADVAGAVVFAERVVSLLREVQVDSSAVTVSAGVAPYSPDMESPDALLAAADGALYEAKAAGRNRIRVFAGFDNAATAEREQSPT